MNPLKFLLPEQHSTVAPQVDNLYYFITWVSIFFFVLIVVLMVWFVVKYRRRDPSDPPGHGAHHNTPLEVTWSVIPLILVIAMFYLGMRGLVVLWTPPENCYAIDVTAKQWEWDFTYPNGLVNEQLHAWAGQPVKLRCTSLDVLHAIFIPEFRVKTDIVPGKFSYVWFEAVDPLTGVDANYTLMCAEYCGTSHSAMVRDVVIHPNEESFLAWLTKAGVRPDGTSPVEWGRNRYERKGCKQCHALTLDEPFPKAPSWLETGRHLVEGGKRDLADGTSVTVNDEYIVESILKPTAKTAKGYQFGLMTPQKLTMEDIRDVIEFMKSLYTESKGKK